MAIVLIAHNGIGLGHLSRCVAICKALSNIGEKPLILAEGSSYKAIPHNYPITRLPKHSHSSKKDHYKLNESIDAYALMSTPSVVVEDTHPLGLELSSQVTRLLVVRPLAFSELKKLDRHYKHVYRSFLLADHPESPTWPYSNNETQIITEWDSWHFIGPIYRHPTFDEINEVKRRYNWVPGRPICVFSLGGGGEHEGANDALKFIKRGSVIAEMLLNGNPSARMIFVKGPLFTASISIPQPFEVVEQEPLMPALFAIANAAIIRPGFNSIWECINGGTPILPILGTSYKEPMQARLRNLRVHGLILRRIKSFWSKPTEQDEFERTCEKLSARFSFPILTDVLSPILEDTAFNSDLLIDPDAFKARVLMVGQMPSTLQELRKVKALAIGLRKSNFEVVNVLISHNHSFSSLPVSEVFGDSPVFKVEKVWNRQVGRLTKILDQFDPHIVFHLSARYVPQGIMSLPMFTFRRHVALESPDNLKDLYTLEDTVSSPHSSQYDAVGPSTVSKGQRKPIITPHVDVAFLEDAPKLPAKIASLVNQFVRIDTNLISSTQLSNYFGQIYSRKLVFIRLDDVSQMNLGVGKLLELANAISFHVSLEVIPYFCKFNDSDLDKTDPLRSSVEISQHGYCHLQKKFHARVKSEFSVNRGFPTKVEMESLIAGKEILERHFPNRFRYGFSPPYDAVPDWLAQAWKQMGGRFISTIYNKPRGAQLPTVSAFVDLWDWANKRKRSLGAIWGDIATSIIRRGYVGLVVHQQHFQSQADIDWFKSLLSQLSEVGFESIPQSKLANLQAQRLLPSPSRIYKSALLNQHHSHE
jgi:hypothetical protein